MSRRNAISDDDGRKDAARLLLSQPLVRASTDPEAHRLIRRHKDALAQSFRNHLGYRLVVEPHFARLYKGGLGPTRSRPLRRSGSGTPFTPRAYAYLALACSVLLTCRQQVLLSGVVKEIRHAGAEAGIELGPDSPADRRALVHALRQLTDWGVISEDDGSVAGYADDPAAEALLWVDRELVRQLLAVPLREVTDPGTLVRVASEPGPDGTRHAVRRRIVEEPVVIADELPEDERAWLRQYQRREAQLAEQLFGLRLEIRAEGIAAFDPLDELSDQSFPREGTLGQAALLSVAELVHRLRPAGTPNAREGLAAAVGFDRGLLGEVVTELLARHGRRWSKEYTEHPNRLLADVEDYLVGMGLVALGADGALSLRAIAARYAPAVDAAPRQPLTFDLGEIT
jgi:uncharacterized protein (TIGR02678 family)